MERKTTQDLAAELRDEFEDTIERIYEAHGEQKDRLAIGRLKPLIPAPRGV